MPYMDQEERASDMEGIPVWFLLKSLLFSYILTGVMLVLLAFLLYKFGLSEKVVSIAIIVIYVAATVFAGFVTGKRMNSIRFLWGLFMGSAYFLVLTAVSFCMGEGGIQVGNSLLTTMVLCAGGGMLGGMLS